MSGRWRRRSRAHRAARQAGADLVLAALSPPVTRLLQITATDTVFHIRPTVRAALTISSQSHGREG